MRLWSLHPKYLDSRGLTALWREALLAREVLRGKTRGYRSHPQLDRFRAQADPLAAIEAYLCSLYAEALRRGFAFDAAKVCRPRKSRKISVTSGQLAFELSHLKKKLKARGHAQYRAVAGIEDPLPNQIFKVTRGGVEPWERVKL